MGLFYFIMRITINFTDSDGTLYEERASYQLIKDMNGSITFYLLRPTVIRNARHRGRNYEMDFGDEDIDFKDSEILFD